MIVTNCYGENIESVKGELSEETKEKFLECVDCWNDISIFKHEIFYCGHYGPCNLHPLIKENNAS